VVSTANRIIDVGQVKRLVGASNVQDRYLRSCAIIRGLMVGAEQFMKIDPT